MSSAFSLIFELLNSNAKTWPVFFSILACVLGSFFIILYYVSDSRVKDLNGKIIPGPKNNLIKPNFNSIVLEGRRRKQLSIYLKDFMLNDVGDGNISAANLYGRKILFVSHPEMVKTVLSGSHFKFPKGARYSRLKFFLGDGLITSSGHKWKTHRGIINPSFHADALKSFVSIFNVQMHTLLNEWDSNSTNGETTANLNKDLTDLTMRIICKSAFGYDFKSEDADMTAPIQIISDELNERMIDPIDDWIYLFPHRFRSVQKAVGRVHTLVNEIISSKMQKRLQNQSTHPSLQYAQEPRDLLDILLDANEGALTDQTNPDSKFSFDELRDHSVSFLAAGHETTSSTLLWVFYELHLNPNILQLCLDEVDAVFKEQEMKNGEVDVMKTLGCRDKWGFVCYDDINKFVYLQQVVKETMRFHPSVPALARMNVDACQLGEYLIPPGCVVGVCIMAIHRHKDFWDKPDEFIPDRFSPENTRSTLKHPFQYIPFSAGPRNCIGQRFASMELVALLALTLKNFTFRIDPEAAANIRFEETITFQPKNITVQLIPRK